MASYWEIFFITLTAASAVVDISFTSPFTAASFAIFAVTQRVKAAARQQREAKTQGLKKTKKHDVHLALCSNKGVR